MKHAIMRSNYFQVSGVNSAANKTPQLSVPMMESALTTTKNQSVSASRGTTVVQTVRGRPARDTARTMHRVS